MAANLNGDERERLARLCDGRAGRLRDFAEHSEREGRVVVATDEREEAADWDRIASILRASSPSGVGMEGWAAQQEANCSCEHAATYEFNAECRHRGMEWGKPATLILHSEVRTP